jgi:hypothetical protein
MLHPSTGEFHSPPFGGRLKANCIDPCTAFSEAKRDLPVFLRFGALYFSRTVGMDPVLFGKNMTPLLKYGWGCKNETSG